jgi:hypothetical protein
LPIYYRFFRTSKSLTFNDAASHECVVRDAIEEVPIVKGLSSFCWFAYLPLLRRVPATRVTACALATAGPSLTPRSRQAVRPSYGLAPAYRDDRDVLEPGVSLVGPVLDGIALRLRVPDQRGFLPPGAQPVTPILAQADLTLLLRQRIA